MEDTGAPYPVVCHLIDTAVIAGRLWDSYLTAGQRRVIAAGWGDERVSHLTTPALLVQLGYPAHGRPLRSIAHQVGQILGGHHGTYSQALTAHALTEPERQEPRVGHTPGWVEQRAAHLHTLHALCGNPAPPAEFGPGGACVLAAGLIVLADWLASRTGWIRARHWERNHTPDANHMAMGGRSIGPTDAPTAHRCTTPYPAPAPNQKDL
ncbi:HD domain-containing protein [Streptomyces nigrescens]|uniref:HD domain-containing protein n=1 Tax=Streptomyces nigrescens TaxID=1920 RepID=UPI002252DB1B|nr:HD domain-containing protein [Streptomyces libani]MCX5451169.1 HD domain-containing protein [Streptomyces libani]